MSNVVIRVCVVRWRRCREEPSGREAENGAKRQKTSDRRVATAVIGPSFIMQSLQCIMVLFISSPDNYPAVISFADDFEKTGFEVCAKLEPTFCLQAFSDSGSLMNKNATNLKVKLLYYCAINSGDLDTFVK